jgi:hypothetical protein
MDSPALPPGQTTDCNAPMHMSCAQILTLSATPTHTLLFLSVHNFCRQRIPHTAESARRISPRLRLSLTLLPRWDGLGLEFYSQTTRTGDPGRPTSHTRAALGTSLFPQPSLFPTSILITPTPTRTYSTRSSSSHLCETSLRLKTSKSMSSP